MFRFWKHSPESYTAQEYNEIVCYHQHNTLDQPEDKNMTYGPIATQEKPFTELTAEQIETLALSAVANAEGHLKQLFSLIDQLSESEQEEIRHSMRSELTCASGRTKPEAVESWAKTNTIEAQMAMAWSASAWSASRVKGSDPIKRRNRMLQITKTSQRVWDDHRVATSCIVELISLRKSKGTSLWARLNSH
jgi:hypothetical protein